MINIAFSTQIIAPHRGRHSGLTYLDASRSSAPRCVLFCRVLAVCFLAFGAGVSGCISAPVAHRLFIVSAGRAQRGLDGGLFAVSTLV